MIRICYENFATGTYDVTALHGKAERGARGVTLYLLPGLTTAQRRRALRRLRQEASRGFGPALPLPPLVLGLARDRLSTAAKTARAVVRLHPAVTLLPSMFLVAVMTLFVMAASGPGNAMKARDDLVAAAVGIGQPATGTLPLRLVRPAIWYTCSPTAFGPVTPGSYSDRACRRVT